MLRNTRSLGLALWLGLTACVAILIGYSIALRQDKAARSASQPDVPSSSRATSNEENQSDNQNSEKPVSSDAQSPDHDELAPGLLAAYDSLADSGTSTRVLRIDPKPSLYCMESTPHPRLAPGAIAARWTGVIVIQENTPIRFGAFVCGELRIIVDGVCVLEGRGESDRSWIESDVTFERPLGDYRIEISYRSIHSLPARVQIWWEGDSFTKEPLPAWRLKHNPAELSEEYRQHALWAKGRDAVDRFGCARCHRDVFPAVDDVPPAPSLEHIQQRINREWLMDWLADPRGMRSDARMPALFSADHAGAMERWLVSEFLLSPSTNVAPPNSRPTRDHRAGRQAFLGIGCVACHPVPESEFGVQETSGRYPLTGLADRFSEAQLAEFLTNPSARYHDGRMPRFPLTPQAAQDIAAYLLTVSPPRGAPPSTAPTPAEISEATERLGAESPRIAGQILFESKGCARCHPGLGESASTTLAIREDGQNHRSSLRGDSSPEPHPGRLGCLSDQSLPRFTMDAETRHAILAYLTIARSERHQAPFDSRQRRLERAGCARCHPRDGAGPAPLEVVARTLWAPFIYRLPYQRTPPLTHVLSKFQLEYLTTAIRDGVSGLRPNWYSYRMPVYGDSAGELIQALAESDGERPSGPDASPTPIADPTLHSNGPALAGFEGYACVSCHLWNGKNLAETDPGSIGPELTTVTQRVRREWFDRWLENPQRENPGTPMPSVFSRNQAAPLQNVLDGNAHAQRDAMWAYFKQGKDAPTPAAKPPIPITVANHESPIVAQIPIQLPSGSFVESITALFATNDLLVFDVASLSLQGSYVRARILRNSGGLGRSFRLDGTISLQNTSATPAILLVRSGQRESPISSRFLGYDRLADGVQLRYRHQYEGGLLEVSETWRRPNAGQTLHREFEFSHVPAGYVIEARTFVPARSDDRQPAIGRSQPLIDVVTLTALHGESELVLEDGEYRARFTPENASAAGRMDYELPPRGVLSHFPTAAPVHADDSAYAKGSLVRPGYQATAYARPQTEAGEDRIMPGAIAIDPVTGQVFVASLKLGEIFVLRDSGGDDRAGSFEDYTRGLFQDALSMLHDGDALYVLHRKNLTRVRDRDQNGVADQFDRIATFPHAVANMYDWGYGLVRDREKGFILSFAPHANQHLPGAGSVARLAFQETDGILQEIAFGLRNPLGWSTGPEGEIFFTDNQGEWVAANRLCHLQPGRFYGFPNPAQREHANKPMAETAIWIPYAWSRSINGVAYDSSRGKFGPFQGQFFLAELMHGGAIIRANVEQINGVYQGACFPFWDRGLLGPLVLAFDPSGRLFVGSITQPGWMGQPDRGAVYRIDFTGEVPFEIQSIHARPNGFRLIFTKPLDAPTARDASSFSIEHYRYEYTALYGSPELDRTRHAVSRVEVSADLRTVDLFTEPLKADRVYAITAAGVRSRDGQLLVHATGAYTLNEIPVP